MSKKIEDYLNDSDVLGIATSAASSFFGSLSKDEIKNCVLNAIWKASKKYDKRHKTKFSSYVHKGVVLECLNQRRFNKNKNQLGNSSYYSIPDPKNCFEQTDMKDLIDSVCEDPSLIYDKYYKNMTIKEMSEDRGLCGETIRIRLKKNLEKVKNAIKKSV